MRIRIALGLGAVGGLALAGYLWLSPKPEPTGPPQAVAQTQAPPPTKEAEPPPAPEPPPPPPVTTPAAIAPETPPVTSEAPPSPPPQAKPAKAPAGSSKPKGGKPPIQDPLAREALSYVGADPNATLYWMAAINDPSLSNHERQDLIEDLNEDGFPNPKQITEEDVPLIVSRIMLIEQIADDAMDQVNADAFAEAYKDLINMLAKLSR